MRRPRQPGVRDAIELPAWVATFALIAALVERRFSISLPAPVMILATLVPTVPCWLVTRTAEARQETQGQERFPLGALVAGILAFAVGVAVRNGLQVRVRGGSADLAHHAAVVHALAANGASGFQDALPSLAFYPIGAHLPVALVVRLTDRDALTTTYVASLIVVVGLFAAVAFVALSLRPRQPWATVAVLVWVGAAWKPIFLDAVMGNFFFSQQAGLTFVVAGVGFTIVAQRSRSHSTPVTLMAFCATVAAACYPTYLPLVLPVVGLWVLRSQPLGVARRSAEAAVILGPAVVAAALSVFPGDGVNIAAHEGTISAVSATGYFGGPILLFLALLATIVTFAGDPDPDPDPAHRARADAADGVGGDPEGGPGVRPWRDYLIEGRWAVVRLWFALTVAFLAGNWLVFDLGLYGSRYNTIKSLYPLAAGLAVLLGAFVGNVTPDAAMVGVSRAVRPFAACAAVVVVAIWATLLSPVGATITPDQIEAVRFASRTAEATSSQFAPLGTGALDYILAVALEPLDPGGGRAPAILNGDRNVLASADVFVAVRPSEAPLDSLVGEPVSEICRFGSATVYARANSPAAAFADRCPA